MRIGIDFDDTLADWGAMMRTEAQRRWQVDLDALRAAGKHPGDHLGQQWTDLIVELLETDLGVQIPIKPGADEVVRRLSERHDLVILTARHDHEMPFARQWVQTNAIPIERFVATCRAPKDVFARDLDLRVHIDDTAAVFDSFVDHPTACSLLLGSVFDRGGGAALAAHVRSVEHWHAFEDLVLALEDEA
ncbi:MAG: hypothetical protein WD800_08675 [Dehalococcoidia bacterium]